MVSFFPTPYNFFTDWDFNYKDLVNIPLDSDYQIRCRIDKDFIDDKDWQELLEYLKHNTKNASIYRSNYDIPEGKLDAFVFSALFEKPIDKETVEGIVKRLADIESRIQDKICIDTPLVIDMG